MQMAPPKPLPKISRGKRAIVAGRTGSGKSTLAQWLLARSPGVWLILNPKWTKAYDKLPNAITIKGFEFEQIEKAMEKYRFVIVNPEPHQSEPENLDAFVEYLHHKYENFGLCCDELYMLHNQGRPGPGLIGVLTRGRELGQSFLGLTQRPAWVSKFLYSESDYIGCMALAMKEDRKKMAENMGGNEMVLNSLPPFEWYWYEIGKDEFRYFAPIPN